MSISFDLNAFSIIRDKDITTIMHDVNRTYTDWNYEFSTFESLELLLDLHPITRKPVNNYIFLTQLKTDCYLVFDDQINSDGCSSLMHNLSRLFGYECTNITSNENSTMFTYYHEKKKRVIYAYKENTKWIFYTDGEILKVEHPEYYDRRMIKKRFNVQILDEYLEGLFQLRMEDIYKAVIKSNCIYAGELVFI